jgi:hypothetical protein
MGWDETAEIERTVFLQGPAELERLDETSLPACST